MATFVLCAGGFTGGWVWRAIGLDTALKDAGHLVFTPTYTGLGERVHLTSPDIRSTHARAGRADGVRVRGLVSRHPRGLELRRHDRRRGCRPGADTIRHIVVLDGYVPEDEHGQHALPAPADVEQLCVRSASQFLIGDS